MMPDDCAAPEAHGLTIEQARVIAGVSRRTIYNWLAAGKIQAVRTAGGSVRILAASLFRPMVSTPEIHR